LEVLGSPSEQDGKTVRVVRTYHQMQVRRGLYFLKADGGIPHASVSHNPRTDARLTLPQNWQNQLRIQKERVIYDRRIFVLHV